MGVTIGGLWGGGGALEAIGFLTQDVEPGVTILVDSHNGFNKMIRLKMIWMVRHLYPAGWRFAFNCYRGWLHILLHQSGDAPVIILSQEGVT